MNLVIRVNLRRKNYLKMLHRGQIRLCWKVQETYLTESWRTKCISVQKLCIFYLVLFPVSWVLFFWLLEGFNLISDIFVLLLIEYSTSVDSTCYWSSNVVQYQLAEFLKSFLCAEHSILISNDTESISWSIFSRSFSTFNSIFIDWEERKKKKITQVYSTMSWL